MTDMDPEMQEWIALHETDDPIRLRLRFHGDESANQAIMQIECRRKAASRLPLALSCKSFMFPTSLSAEQATSEALASVHAHIAGYAPGSRHLDLTCGLAIDSLEAARRGALVTAIDIDPEIARVANHNAAALHLGNNFTALCADSSEFVRNSADKWDTVFIDPARRSDSGRRLTAIADCRPDVTSILPQILHLAPKLIIKASPMLDMTALTAELNHAAMGLGAVVRIIAIGTARECKELVAVVERGPSQSLVTEAITVLPSTSSPIHFTVPSVDSASPTLQHPLQPGSYLYEPYPAVMKTGAWGALSQLSPHLMQLHPNTHLFTSQISIPYFPGTSLIIERVEPMNDKALKSIAKEYPKINIATRNFPISAPELAKKLRIKEGGDMQLYGARVGSKGIPTIIVCRKAQP